MNTPDRREGSDDRFRYRVKRFLRAQGVLGQAQRPGVTLELDVRGGDENDPRLQAIMEGLLKGVKANINFIFGEGEKGLREGTLGVKEMEGLMARIGPILKHNATTTYMTNEVRLSAGDPLRLTPGGEILESHIISELYRERMANSEGDNLAFLGNRHRIDGQRTTKAMWMEAPEESEFDEIPEDSWPHIQRAVGGGPWQDPRLRHAVFVGEKYRLNRVEDFGEIGPEDNVLVASWAYGWMRDDPEVGGERDRKWRLHCDGRRQMGIYYLIPEAEIDGGRTYLQMPNNPFHLKAFEGRPDLLLKAANEQKRYGWRDDARSADGRPRRVTIKQGADGLDVKARILDGYNPEVDIKEAWLQHWGTWRANPMPTRIEYLSGGDPGISPSQDYERQRQCEVYVLHEM